MSNIASIVTRPLNLQTDGWVLPVATLAIGTFAIGTDSFVLAGILPEIAQAFRISPGTAGLTVTAFAMTYAVAAPILATVLGRVARKTLLLWGLAAFVAANLGAAAAPNFGLLLVARVLTGIAAAMFTPTASAAAAALGGTARRGTALSIILGGLTVGTVFGVPLGTGIGQRLGWQASLLFVAAVGVLAALALHLTLRPLPLPAATSLRQRLALFANGQVMLAASVNAASVCGGIMVYTYVAEVMGQTAGIVGATLTLALFIWGAGGSVGTFLSGWLSDHIGPNPTIIIMLLALILSLLALGFSTVPAIAILLLALFSAGGWGVTSPNNARLVAMVPAQAGLALSLNASGSYIGQAIGALLGGIILSSAGAVGICLAGTGIGVVALALHALTLRHSRSRPS